jgi:hypothetical protein
MYCRGDGLGKRQNGISSYVSVQKKFDTKGLGAEKLDNDHCLYSRIENSYDELLQKVNLFENNNNKKRKKKNMDQIAENKDDNNNGKRKSKEIERSSSFIEDTSESKKKSKKETREKTKNKCTENTEKSERKIERSFLITAATGKQKRMQHADMSPAIAEHLERLKSLRDQETEKLKNRSLVTKESINVKRRRIK